MKNIYVSTPIKLQLDRQIDGNRFGVSIALSKHELTLNLRLINYTQKKRQIDRQIGRLYKIERKMKTAISSLAPNSDIEQSSLKYF